MLKVFEAIDGPISNQFCLFDKPVCDQGKCVLGSLMNKVVGEIRHHLSETRLADFLATFRQGKQ
jgi:DNA-binding IscR family transcriptional regulator